MIDLYTPQGIVTGWISLTNFKKHGDKAWAMETRGVVVPAAELR